MSLLETSIVELSELLHKGEITSKEITEASFQRIAQVDGKVKSFLTLNEEAALAQAAAFDSNRDAFSSVLAGIPVGIKDNIVTKGLRTTCASKILHNFDPIYDATVMNKLNGAGAVVVGKLNMDEFAMGSSTENSGFHPTYNPWDLNRVPGGSSGGSAAAVASGQVLYTLGSDTGGSIRQPASYCGVVGLKPTYGRVSRFGLVAFASSLDQIGPITRTVADNAHVLPHLVGVDPYDSTSAPVEVPDFTAGLTGDIKGLRIGLPSEYFGEGVDAGVRDAVQKAIAKLEELGATVHEVSLPHSKYG
ncbi:MAG: amidase, partial [Bacilli bacterium]